MTLRPLRRPEPRQPRRGRMDEQTKQDLEIARQDTIKIRELQAQIAEYAEHRRQVWIRLRDRNVSLRKIAAVSDISAQAILNSTTSDG